MTLKKLIYCIQDGLNNINTNRCKSITYQQKQVETLESNELMEEKFSI